MNFEDRPNRAPEIATSLATTADGVSHALVILIREDPGLEGHLDIGLAGPSKTAATLLEILEVIKAHMAQNYPIAHAQRVESATIGGHPIKLDGEGEN